jgi:hypothetical protein
MPFIDAKVSVPITPAQQESLKQMLGKAISLIPGKSETWLMLNIQPECRLYFQGSNKEPAAMVEVKLFGSASSSAYQKMTAEVTKIVSSELDIPESRIFVKYEEAQYWGWNGSNL